MSPHPNHPITRTTVVIPSYDFVHNFLSDAGNKQTNFIHIISRVLENNLYVSFTIMQEQQ